MGVSVLPPDLAAQNAPAMWNTYLAVDDVDATLARVDAAGGTVLPAAAQYVLTGSGFTANLTQVLLGTVPLRPADGTPGAGEFSVNPAGTAITLIPPAALPSGTYQIRVRVAEIEADPAHWLVIS